MAHSSHRGHRGCGLCKPHQWRGQGPARRWPHRVLRQFGVKRRLSRHQVVDE